MNPKPLAFSPGSITAYFQILSHPVTGFLHSTGLSLNIREGVMASLKEAKKGLVFLNGQPIEIPTVTTVVQRLSPVPLHLSLETPLPLGAGFGVSAAASLSTAFAINSHFDLKQKKEDLEKIAYRAEIEHKTGVGDVAAQIEGGIVYRHAADSRRIQLTLDVPDFYCSVYGPLSTRSVLQSSLALEKINQAGQTAIHVMETGLPGIRWNKLLEIAWDFSRGSGLLTKEVVGAAEKIQRHGGKAFMIMIGNSLLSTLPDPEGIKVWKTNIDRQGTRYL